MTAVQDAGPAGPVALAAGAWIGAGAIASAALAVIGGPPGALLAPGFTAHVTGLLAGYGIAVMLVLMARVPALEAGVGADRLARWHARGGRAVLVLMLVHAVAATVGLAVAQGVTPAAATAQVLAFPGLLAATAATAVFIAVAVVSIRTARRRLGYEAWHLLHLGTYLAVALAFVHELAGPDLAGHPVLQTWWSLLYTAAFALVLRYRLLRPLLGCFRHRLRVRSVVEEGEGVVSLVVAGRHLDELRAEPGQFFRWRFLTRGTWHLANPFSLSAPPSPTELRLTVKALGAGTRAIHAVRPGTRVLAEGPYGAMTARRSRGAGVLLIAGGVGITPMRTLFETVPGDRVALLYRSGSERDVLFRGELEEIAARRGGQLLLLTGPSADPALTMDAANLLRWVPDVATRDVYLCASPRLAAATRAALREAGVPVARIHHEEFAF